MPAVRRCRFCGALHTVFSPGAGAGGGRIYHDEMRRGDSPVRTSARSKHGHAPTRMELMVVGGCPPNAGRHEDGLEGVPRGQLKCLGWGFNAGGCFLRVSSFYIPGVIDDGYLVMDWEAWIIRIGAIPWDRLGMEVE